ncbi:hypothetical protein PDIG_61980 [Penicillium digitatum PHI26]|uniref:Uncharacterized protein n=2 Tax=Penicillium digitatum TaxID=36651 RepID=K9G421_PEND2|nr:hypothetical protein PDIP_71370 [Penicillium digitatum Pd1]EKV07857.1 hypothetical protein PDIP_71370 [Penicillium digitatum Pd1]EKV09588.1 hypothetical protein PDIG_61980 [Penicillium digitatum PHI26]
MDSRATSSFCIASHSTLSVPPIYTLGNTQLCCRCQKELGMDAPLTYSMPGDVRLNHWLRGSIESRATSDEGE